MTLLISTKCDTPECEGDVSFGVPDGGPRHGRLTGRCLTCGALYDLYGGQQRRFDPTGPMLSARDLRPEAIAHTLVAGRN